MKRWGSFGIQWWRPVLSLASSENECFEVLSAKDPPGHLLAAISKSKEASKLHKAILITGMLSVHIYVSVSLSGIMDLTGRMC